ncbi:serine hydrolase [Streptococcus dentasini]
MTSLKRMFTAGLLALGLLASPAVQASEKLPSGNTYDNIGSKIEAFVDQHKDTTAGMETAVFTADETLYEGHFGYMDKEKGLKANEGSVFEWGSTTKTVTWISVMQQVEAGRIDLKEDIRTYLPKGFLRNLKFDKPVTMLDLMNHKGGFQDTAIKAHAQDYEHIIPLKDYLSQVQPPQIEEPGTVTSYSNWGTALAAYIVEHVSGRTFSDYVHQKIFQPLGMKHTSIAPDLSDNAYVKKERAKNQSYDAEGKGVGEALEISNRYPDGGIIGTLKDLKIYAQALLKQEAGVLFEQKATWDELFSASDVYGNSDIPRNRHGFWTGEYAVDVTEHGGNTIGYSTALKLDLKNDIGMVVMTNQVAEMTYNLRMPELVFGNYKDSPYAKMARDSFSGYYRPLGAGEGPMSFTSRLMGITKGQSDHFENSLGAGIFKFYKTSKLPDDRQAINVATVDYIAVSQGEVWLAYGTAIAGALAAIYALGHFLISLTAWIVRKVKKQGRPVPSKTWQHLLSGLILASALIFSILFITMGSIALIDFIPFLAIGFALIGLALIGLIIWRLIRRPKAHLDWKAKLHYGLTVTASLATLWFIYFFDLYQWWVL